MRLWILFKPSVLDGFFDTALAGEQKVLPYYCQVGLEVQVPHSASIGTKEGKDSLLLLTRGENSGSLIGLAGRGRNASLLFPTWLPLTPQVRRCGAHNCLAWIKVPAPYIAFSDTISSEKLEHFAL